MLLVAYTVPAFTWFASLFTEQNSTKKKFAIIYFIFHFLVEAYAFILPVYRLHTYWNDPTQHITPMGAITVKWYLIINCTVTFVMMILTMHIACCIN